MTSLHEMFQGGFHIVMLSVNRPGRNPIENFWEYIQAHTTNRLWPTIGWMDEVVGPQFKDWWIEPMKVISLFDKG
jgi:hypothetical protein